MKIIPVRVHTAAPRGSPAHAVNCIHKRCDIHDGVNPDEHGLHLKIFRWRKLHQRHFSAWPNDADTAIKFLYLKPDFRQTSVRFIVAKAAQSTLLPQALSLPSNADAH
jgi:hypothetical protein